MVVITQQQRRGVILAGGSGMPLSCDDVHHQVIATTCQGKISRPTRWTVTGELWKRCEQRCLEFEIKYGFINVA